jgi:hypothetical protein
MEDRHLGDHTTRDGDPEDRVSEKSRHYRRIRILGATSKNRCLPRDTQRASQRLATRTDGRPLTL